MEEFARLILGVLAAINVLVLVQTGPKGVAAWWKAKFLGEIA